MHPRAPRPISSPVRIASRPFSSKPLPLFQPCLFALARPVYCFYHGVLHLRGSSGLQLRRQASRPAARCAAGEERALCCPGASQAAARAGGALAPTAGGPGPGLAPPPAQLAATGLAASPFTISCWGRVGGAEARACILSCAACKHTRSKRLPAFQPPARVTLATLEHHRLLGREAVPASAPSRTPRACGSLGRRTRGG